MNHQNNVAGKIQQVGTSRKELVTVITASSVGTMIEWYDFYIFGSLATIISTQFFPKENASIAFLATLATFAAGLIVRPFGALFFGRLGDLIGRKYTFMVTLLLMGGSTFLIGLIPKYETIGFWAPVIILILRLLQGLAIGGEYGGAATFVAEYSPVRKRGFWTSWIQITAITGFFISLAVILITKSIMKTTAWEDWGWRIPFLISIFMVGVSVYIRKNMAESPLFAKAKAEGKTAVNPLKESFGNKENLKVVLLALFGVTIGIGATAWASVFYVQHFLVKISFLEYDQVNKILMCGLLPGSVFMIVFGWLSDYTGRKPLMMLSLLLSVLCFRPIFEKIYQTTNLQHKTENTSAVTISSKRALLSVTGADSLLTTSTQRFFTDGTVYKEVRKDILHAGRMQKPEIIKTIQINNTDKWVLIAMIFLLEVICSMSYGPLAAYLVEMFPLKIRYSSLSVPYHIGYGIFGGMCPVIATYLVEKARLAGSANYYLAGLNYPNVLMALSFIVGVLYLKEKKGIQSFISIHSKGWNNAKKWMGMVWILLGITAVYLGLFQLGLPKLRSGNQDDIIFGSIVMFFITPVASIGLLFFGKYALQGAYDE